MSHKTFLLIQDFPMFLFIILLFSLNLIKRKRLRKALRIVCNRFFSSNSNLCTNKNLKLKCTMDIYQAAALNAEELVDGDHHICHLCPGDGPVPIEVIKSKCPAQFLLEVAVKECR